MVESQTRLGWVGQGPQEATQSNILLQAGLTVHPDHIAQGFVQLSIEKLQGQRLHNLSGQPAPRSEIFISLYPAGIFLFQLRITVSCSSAMHISRNCLCLLSNLPRGTGGGCCQVFHSWLFSRMEKTQALSLSSKIKCSSHDHPDGLGPVY